MVLPVITRSAFGFFKFSFLCWAFLAMIIFAVPAQAKLKTKEEKHFDINQDGRLDINEQMFYRTHKITGYPLITKDKQKPYDFNYNFMLDPFEQQMYLKDKANGTLKDDPNTEVVSSDPADIRYKTNKSK